MPSTRIIYQAYFNVFRRAGLEVDRRGQSDVGMMGGSMAHEFMALLPIGEDTLIVCEQCGYTGQPPGRHLPQAAAPRRRARCRSKRCIRPTRPRLPPWPSSCGIDAAQTAKAVFLMAEIDGPDGKIADSVRLCRGARRHGGERDQTHQRHQGAQRAPGHGRGDPRRGRRGGLWLARWRQARPGAAAGGRPGGGQPQPGGGRQPPRLSPAQHQLRPRLHRPTW